MGSGDPLRPNFLKKCGDEWLATFWCWGFRLFLVNNDGEDSRSTSTGDGITPTNVGTGSFLNDLVF